MGVQTMIDGVNTLWKEDLSTAKEARNVNSFYFPHTSLLLQNPYLKLQKNRKCHLSDFLMSLKMFKKSSKNSKIIFFTTYFSSSYPMLNMSMHVDYFFLENDNNRKEDACCCHKAAKNFLKIEESK